VHRADLCDPAYTNKLICQTQLKVSLKHIVFAPSSGVISQFFGGTVKPYSLALFKHLEKKPTLHFSHDALCISFVLYLYQFAPVLQTKAVLEYQM